MRVAIFDIDGTIADCSHRLHFIEGPKKDWKSFFENVKNDTPIYPVLKILWMHQSIDAPYVIVSGRSEECRAETIKWLDKYFVKKYRKLYMRRKEDRRPDYIVKEEILREIREKDRLDPDIVFDDRRQVVDMWRRNGIVCAQVAEGEF